MMYLKRPSPLSVFCKKLIIMKDKVFLTRCFYVRSSKPAFLISACGGDARMDTTHRVQIVRTLSGLAVYFYVTITGLELVWVSVSLWLPWETCHRP